MASAKRKAVQNIVDTIFLESITPLITVHEASHEIIHGLNRSGDPIAQSALGEIGCNPSGFYIETEDLHYEIINSRRKKDLENNIISRYDFHEGRKDKLIRADKLREEDEREAFLMMLLNQESINDYLLNDHSNTNKDSNFEKLCAILLRERYQCEKVGVLRESPSKDGGLDFFGIRAATLEGNRKEFIFGQAKRRQSISSPSVNDFIKQWEDGFIPMALGRPSYQGYELADGKPIQRKLLKAIPEITECAIKPMVACPGDIPKTQIIRLTNSPVNGIVIKGIKLTQSLCISLSKSDPEGYRGWFESDFPHKFIPVAFDGWLEEQLDSLIIVDKEA